MFLSPNINITYDSNLSVLLPQEIENEDLGEDNNYDSFIQKINGSYDIGTSQVIKIESFNVYMIKNFTFDKLNILQEKIKYKINLL